MIGSGTIGERHGCGRGGGPGASAAALSRCGWQAELGEMSMEEAKREFLSRLHGEVPAFGPWFIQKSAELAEEKRRAAEVRTLCCARAAGRR